MILEIHPPAPPLRQCIESFIYYRDFLAEHLLDRLLPDGNVTLIIDLKEGAQGIYDNETLEEIQTCRHSWLSGIRSRPITIPSGTGNELFIVNFHKGRSYPLLKTPLSAIRDQVVDGDQVFGPSIHALREIIRNEPVISCKFQAAEAFFMRRVNGNPETNPFIQYAVDRILRVPEQQTIAALSDRVGFSQKHLIHLFKTHVGLTPKAFMRVIRFQKTIADIEKSPTVDWRQIAFAGGYYDQAHFIHDFREFSGFTPEQYLRVKNDQVNYVPVSG